MDLITLEADATRLSIAPVAGGSIARYWSEHPGRTIEWMRPTPAAALKRRMPLAYSSFPLVPYSGRIRDGRFTFRGRAITLPLNFLPENNSIHGQAWQLPWSVVQQEKTTATIDIRHKADEWPWNYRASQRFTLAPERLTLEMSLTNEGPDAMPAGLGPHPYFVRTPQTTVTAGVQKVWLNDAEVMPLSFADPPADRDLRRGVRVDGVAMDNCFTGWDRRAVIEWPEWQARLTMTADAPLDFLVVYTPPKQDFFCVEPVSHAADAVNFINAGRTDTGLLVLEPGQTLRVTARFDTATS